MKQRAGLIRSYFCSMMPQPSAVMTHKYTPCSHTHRLHTHSAPRQPLLTSIQPSKQPRSLSNAPTHQISFPAVSRNTDTHIPTRLKIWDQQKYVSNKITHKSFKSVGDAVEEEGWSHFVCCAKTFCNHDMNTHSKYDMPVTCGSQVMADSNSNKHNLSLPSQTFSKGFSMFLN